MKLGFSPLRPKCLTKFVSTNLEAIAAALEIHLSQVEWFIKYTWPNHFDRGDISHTISLGVANIITHIDIFLYHFSVWNHVFQHTFHMSVDQELAEQGRKLMQEGLVKAIRGWFLLIGHRRDRFAHGKLDRHHSCRNFINVVEASPSCHTLIHQLNEILDFELQRWLASIRSLISLFMGTGNTCLFWFVRASTAIQLAAH